jgi:HlyD family secretion protein
MKKVFIAVVVVAVVAVAMIGFRVRGSGGPAADMGPQAIAAERGPIRVIVSASGVLEPIYQVEVKSKASGLIEKMPVEEGDTVVEGQLLAELDKTEAQSEYDQAKANLASAQANLQYLRTHLARQEELYEKKLISDLEMEETKLELVRAESQRVGAEANLTTATQRLDDTIVRSPIAGVVLLKSVEAGQIISSGINSYTGGTTIAAVADMSQMLVRTSVDEVDIGSVEVAQIASVRPDAFPTEVNRGRVIRIAPQGQVEQNVTTFEVTVQIPNPDLRLKSGMNCSVDLMVAERSDAILVPVEAVGNSSTIQRWLTLMPNLQFPDKAPGRSADGAPEMRPAGEPGGMYPGGIPGVGEGGPDAQFVIVKEDGQPTLRPVKVGLNDMERVEILEGLEEGEEVLIASHSRALQARAEFQERIRNRSMSGFRKAN